MVSRKRNQGKARKAAKAKAKEVAEDSRNNINNNNQVNNEQQQSALLQISNAAMNAAILQRHQNMLARC